MEQPQQQALVPVNPANRSVVTFGISSDPWPTIAAWAQKHRYLPREPQTGNVKMFQKGSGFWTAPMRAQFTQTGTQIEMQAWVHNPLLARIIGESESRQLADGPAFLKIRPRERGSEQQERDEDQQQPRTVLVPGAGAGVFRSFAHEVGDGKSVGQ